MLTIAFRRRAQRAAALLLMVLLGTSNLAGVLLAQELPATSPADPVVSSTPAADQALPLVFETDPLPAEVDESETADPGQPDDAAAPSDEPASEDDPAASALMAIPPTSPVGPDAPVPFQGCTLVSDGTYTLVDGEPALEIAPNPAWSSALAGDGAKWIWTGDAGAQQATFVRAFHASAAGSGILSIAADNTYEVKVNGASVSCANTGEFNYANTYTCGFPLVQGVNTLEITVGNLYGLPTPENPAGLYYRLQVPDTACTPVATVEVCKVAEAGEGYEDLPGWQVYLAGPTVDTLDVPANQIGGVDSDPLSAGMSYLVTAMGTWLNARGEQNLVDAEYSTTDGWTTVMDGYDGFSTDILELQINETFDPQSDWGPFSDAHAYARLFAPAASGPANFRIFDGTGTTPNPGWYGDNQGSLTVRIDEAHAGTTGEDGCVTLENVPYGTYAIGEIAQEGWELVQVLDGEDPVDGLMVTVDESFERFTLVNEETGPELPLQCVVTSDETTLEGGQMSFIQTYLHPSWTAIVNGAQWIWGDPAIVDPVGDTTQTFTKVFQLNSVPATGGALTLAADNSYTVVLNDVEIGADAGEVNYSEAGKDVITVPASALKTGKNTLEITVKNFAMAGGTALTNPAGLKYALVIDGTVCTEPEPAPEPEPQAPVKVWIYKHLQNDEGTEQLTDDSDAPSFPMRSSWVWNAPQNNTGTDAAYVLGNFEGNAPYRYAAVTSAMPAPADYSTYEVTTGDEDPSTIDDPESPVIGIGGECVPGKYRLVGYKTGTTLALAEAADVSGAYPSFTGLTSDRHVIVVNEYCGDENPPEGEEPPIDDDPPADDEPPVVIGEPTPTNGGGGRGRSGGSNRSTGEVLGASTEGEVLGAACPLLTDFMREGMANDAGQVSLLQQFLNTEMGLALPVTGFFGGLTTAAVNAFQLKYQPEVLAPWAPFGYSPTQPTGYVFKTTLWKINDIACPDLDAPFPALP